MIELPANLRPQEDQTNGGGPKPPDEPLLLMAAAEMGQEGRFDRPASAESAIEGAAERHGLDPAVLKGIAGIESSMNPESNRYRSTQYKGLFQIGREEWAQYGRGGDIYNADQNADAAARMLKDHAAWFKDRTGQEPSPGQLYMMHQQGRGFYQHGTMTNIAGNPYPGMRGPQTPASFEAGWTARLGREIARFGGEPGQAVAASPRKSVWDKQGGGFDFDYALGQAPPAWSFLAKGVPNPKTGNLKGVPPSKNIERRKFGVDYPVELKEQGSEAGGPLSEDLGAKTLDELAALHAHGLKRLEAMRRELQDQAEEIYRRRPDWRPR
jgi:Transglycosylase SLT domain